MEFNLENEKIVEVNVEDEIKQSFLDYSMSVIVSRALPDVRDGLKPVHRRILYSMDENGLTHEKPTRKCATIVGSVLGAYHPHGDSSVYGALVRLAQSFSMRYPLVEGQGNFGSVDGDPPAAYRYTEARMARIANLMLEDIDKDTVDFIPNFDDTTTEPEVLPARLPNLLINGSQGIAVGMATNIPPHNLTEVLNAVDYLIDNPDCNVLDLMSYVQGPDFPTGGIIMGRSGIRAAYATGRGKIILRGRAEIEEHNGRNRIIVTEIPYMVNKAELIKNIADLVKDKRIEGISDLRDESDKKGMRIVIELKRDANAQIVLNMLYKLTQLQDSVGVIMLALDHGVPKIMDLKTILEKYIEFQEEIVRRRTQFNLKKAKERAHIVEGLTRAVDIVDEIIYTIRHTDGGQTEAKLAIMEKFGFDDPQATAIVMYRLGQLAGLEIKKLESELAELNERIADLEDILVNEKHLTSIIKSELAEIRQRFGDERKTSIEAVSGDVDIEDLIPEEECIIARTHFGYIKRQSVAEFRAQGRGGRGVTGITRKDEDFVEDLYSCNSHDHLLFMTSFGRVYTIKSYTIPEGSRQSRGTNIVNILPLLPDEKVSSVLKIDDFNDESKYLVMVTKNGVVKRSSLSLFQKIRKTGIYGIELDEGDELAWARVTSGDDSLLIATKYGMAIRFRETDARAMGRTTRGVRAITLKEGDEVVGMAIASVGGKILTVTDQGKGRLTPVENYHLQKRGGLGSRNYDCSGGVTVAGVRAVDEYRDDAILISENGTVIRMHVDSIATQSRYGGGVRVMRVDEGDRVVTVACTLRDDLDDEEILEESTAEPMIDAPSEDEIEEMLAENLTEEE